MRHRYEAALKVLSGLCWAAMGLGLVPVLSVDAVGWIRIPADSTDAQAIYSVGAAWS